MPGAITQDVRRYAGSNPSPCHALTATRRYVPTRETLTVAVLLEEENMAKLEKSLKREKKNRKARQGMKVRRGGLEAIGNSIDKRRSKNGNIQNTVHK